ncbi:hypothetical protein PsAD13_05150 [Pseudovibrio sp. Ad13]|nr:hypothetical protein PsAD13_05150 [Pseudovibrio sp. Ad13]
MKDALTRPRPDQNCEYVGQIWGLSQTKQQGELAVKPRLACQLQQWLLANLLDSSSIHDTAS